MSDDNLNREIVEAAKLQAAASQSQAESSKTMVYLTRCMAVATILAVAVALAAFAEQQNSSAQFERAIAALNNFTEPRLGFQSCEDCVTELDLRDEELHFADDARLPQMENYGAGTGFNSWAYVYTTRIDGKEAFDYLQLEIGHLRTNEVRGIELLPHRLKGDLGIAGASGHIIISCVSESHTRIHFRQKFYLNFVHVTDTDGNEHVGIKYDFGPLKPFDPSVSAFADPI